MTPDDFAESAKALDWFNGKWATSERAGMAPEAEQFFLAAVASVAQAAALLRLAEVAQVRALAGGRS